jgi:hypothetical protein
MTGKGLHASRPIRPVVAHMGIEVAMEDRDLSLYSS